MRTTTFVAFASLFAAHSLSAAKAPRAQAELEAESAHIVSGTVLKIESVVEDSKIETGFGNHTDRIYTIHVRVTTVTKGEEIKEGDVIRVSAWQPERRFPPVPGLQGHEDIPTKGNRVTLFLKGKDEDGKHHPILPNGIRTND